MRRLYASQHSTVALLRPTSQLKAEAHCAGRFCADSGLDSRLLARSALMQVGLGGMGRESRVVDRLGPFPVNGTGQIRLVCSGRDASDTSDAPIHIFLVLHSYGCKNKTSVR
jgi:hypothetical protein